LVILCLILILALVGTCSSTVFLGLTALGVIRFRTEARRALNSAPGDAQLPPVSVLKPVHGLEAQLRQNIESFFRQDYPDYEILFGIDEPDDAALPLVREICALYPHVRSRILVTGKPAWPNPQTYSLHCLAEAAQHGFLVASDSDVEVSPSYLREVVAPLLDPKVGMVTCLYRGKNAAGFWSGLSALGMSVEEPAGVLVANLLEGMKFGLGPTIAVRQDALAAIGGYEAFHDYFANDFMLGNLIHKAGYQVVLSNHVIDHIVNQPTFSHMWQNQQRWAWSNRYTRPKGHLGVGLTFAVPFGILGLLAAAFLGRPVLGTVLLGAAILNRILLGWLVGWCVVRDPQIHRAPWIYPLRDLLGFIVWFGSFLGTGIVWRGSRYHGTGARIASRQASGM
jgi:ceramide glucosyltransferase